MQGDKPRCAIYCRVANDSADTPGEAIERQRQQVAEYARKMGYAKTALYLDNGRSGNDPDRPGLAKLNADIEAGEIGVVLVKDPSRLWRDYAKGGQWFSRMDKLGVTVLCQSAPGFQQDMQGLRDGLPALPKRKKRKQERHTVRTPPPPSNAR